MIDGYQYMPSTGWVCPKCGKVYAPWVSECSQCRGITVMNTDVCTDYKICKTEAKDD